MMSAPVDISAGRGRRRLRPSRDKDAADARDASSPHDTQTATARDVSSPRLSSSATWSSASNRDSGYVPSPAGALRFDWDSADPGDEGDLDTPPSAPRRRPATRPIAIPGGRGGPACGGLQTPAASALLRRRRRQWRSLSTDSSDDEHEDVVEFEADDDDVEDQPGDETEGRGAKTGGRRHCRGDGDFGKTRRCAQQSGGGEQMATGDTDETDHQPVVQDRGGGDDEVVKMAHVQPMHMAWSDTALISSGARPREYRLQRRVAQLQIEAAPARDGSGVGSGAGDGAGVERDVGQELREIADSLRLSRSAPGDLQPRRDIWTMLRRTISFRVGPEAAAPANRVRRPARNTGH